MMKRLLSASEEATEGKAGLGERPPPRSAMGAREGYRMGRRMGCNGNACVP